MSSLNQTTEKENKECFPFNCVPFYLLKRESKAAEKWPEDLAVVAKRLSRVAELPMSMDAGDSFLLLM